MLGVGVPLAGPAQRPVLVLLTGLSRHGVGTALGSPAAAWDKQRQAPASGHSGAAAASRACPRPETGPLRWPGPACPGTRARVGGCTLQPSALPFVTFSVHSAFDLVNIHLFHDASNLVAWETSPSVYAGIRHKALGYVLDR